MRSQLSRGNVDFLAASDAEPSAFAPWCRLVPLGSALVLVFFRQSATAVLPGSSTCIPIKFLYMLIFENERILNASVINREKLLHTLILGLNTLELKSILCWGSNANASCSLEQHANDQNSVFLQRRHARRV